jgi:hypothetical protein
MFSKANHKDYFDEGDVIYLTLISKFGGQIKLKALFMDDKGMYGPPEIPNAPLKKDATLFVDEDTLN